MCPLQCTVVISLLLFHVSYCQRRIVDGVVPALNQTFMVYFVKASVSPENYDEWICGGALITSDLIVTSAACVEDVRYMYAVAGYTKYVSDAKFDSDPCTSSKLTKKVIMTCVPKSYELDYGKLEKWSFIDIAVAQVESPYREDDFDAACSYMPKPIQVNFEEKYQAPSTDSMVLGWGHTEKWRKEDDANTYNSENLLAAFVTLADKDHCITEYAHFQGMKTVIEKYMICSHGAGNIDSKGEMLVTSAPSADGCAMSDNGRRSKTCDDTSSDLVLVESIRRKGLSNMTVAENSKNNTKVNVKTENSMKNNTKVKNNMENNTKAKNDLNINKNIANNIKLFNKNETKSLKADLNNTIPLRFMNTRRHGICQNDHGGPIVTWAGGHEILIGVASVFKIASDYKCEGPYLYTSTQCNGAFLNCIMTQASSDSSRPRRKENPTNDDSRRKFCESPPEVKGFKIVKNHISWTDHPDGPSEIDLQSNKTSTTTDRPSELDHKLNKKSPSSTLTYRASEMDLKLTITPNLSLNTDGTSEIDYKLNITSTRSLNNDTTSEMDNKLNITSTRSLINDRTSTMALRFNVTSTPNISQLNNSMTSSRPHL